MLGNCFFYTCCLPSQKYNYHFDQVLIKTTSTLNWIQNILDHCIYKLWKKNKAGFNTLTRKGIFITSDNCGLMCDFYNGCPANDKIFYLKKEI